MKKVLLATAIAGLTALPASADLLFGGDFSYSAFSPDTEFSSSGTTSTSSDGTPSSFSASIEHPIPLIPNIKIRYIESETGGLGLTTDYDYSATDFILYYEFVDTDILSLDAGISVSEISNEFNSSKFDNSVFGGYANAEIGLPGTALAIFGEAVVGFVSSDSGTTTSDIQVGVRYKLLSRGVTLSVDAGYRIIDNDYDDFDGLDATFKQDGFFGGATLDF